jgi:hypothetical protein
MLKNIFGEYIYIGKLDENLKNDLKNSFFNKKNEISKNKGWDCDVNTTFFKEKSFIHNYNNDIVDFDDYEKELIIHIKKMINDMNVKRKIGIECKDHWFNLYNETNYQEHHDHSGDNLNYVSICLINVNNDKLVDNNLFIYNENYKIKNLSGITDIIDLPDNKQYYYPELNEGDIIIFPSYMTHGVRLIKNKLDRLTIASNIFIYKLD